MTTRNATYWFEQIKDEKIRAKAVANIQDNKTEFASLHDALAVAFWWSKTDEGAFYWKKVYESLKENNKSPQI